MKALKVQGDGAVFDKISVNVGLLGQYGPWVISCGMATLNGREGTCSSPDMAPSSSASQSERPDGHRGDGSGDGVERNNDLGEDFRPIMAILLVFVHFPPQPATSISCVSTSRPECCQTALYGKTSLLYGRVGVD